MSTALFVWLVQSALVSTVILFSGTVALRFFRQPVDGVRIAQWTLVATSLALLLACWPSTSRISLELVGTEPIAATAAVAATPVPPEHLARVILVPEETIDSAAAAGGEQLTNPASATDAPGANNSAPTTRRWFEWAESDMRVGLNAAPATGRAARGSTGPGSGSGGAAGNYTLSPSRFTALDIVSL